MNLEATLFCAGSAGLVLASLLQWARQVWHARRETHTYAQDIALSAPTPYAAPLPISLGLQNGKRQVKTFYFPRGITHAHLVKLGDVVAAGKKPTSRALKPVYDHAAYEAMRNYLMIPQYNHIGVLAEYLSGREDWDVTPLGRQIVIQWRAHTTPPPLLSRHVKVRVYQGAKQSEQSFDKPKPIPKGE